MVNTVAKGRIAQRKVQVRLEAEGYLVDHCGKQSRFGSDLFGLFDLLAIKKGVLVAIQVTCNTPHTHKHYVAFVQTYGPWADIRVEQYVWMDRKGFKVFVYHNDGTYTQSFIAYGRKVK